MQKRVLLSSTVLFIALILASCSSQNIAAKELEHAYTEITATPEMRSTVDPIEKANGELSTPTEDKNSIKKTPIPLPSAMSKTADDSGQQATTPCLQERGTITSSSLDIPLQPYPLDVRVYLPPCYYQNLTQRYPVLYLFHGQNYTDDQWDRLGVDETADRLINLGEAPSFIIVMPRDRLWTNPEYSPFGDAFIHGLLPWVEETYRTIPDRQHRAIGGLSRGGAWAIHIGLSQWKFFSSIGVHSSFFFLGEEYLTQHWIETIPSQYLPRLYLDIGADDELRSATEKLEIMLTNHPVPHEWYIFPGRHEEAYWQSHIEQYLRWYIAPWQDQANP